MFTRYSALKAFGNPDRLAPLRDALRAPVHVRIKPINACNQRCWYCAYRLDDLSLGGETSVRDSIPAAKMFEIVDDLIMMDVKAVTFSGGGEPLIYPHIAQTVRRLGAGGLRIGTLTNSVALHGAIAAAFAEHATWVRISIDAADGASYARSHRVPAALFDGVLTNVRDFVRRGTRAEVGFSFIVTADNAGAFAEFCALAKGLGVGRVKLSACVVSNDAAENNAYHAPITDLVEANIAAAHKLEGPDFQIFDHDHAFAERFERPYATCPMQEFPTVIGADCTVYTCQDKAYTSAGTLGSNRRAALQRFLALGRNIARIRGWDAAQSCRHHWVSHAKNLLLTEYRALDAEHAVFV